MVDPILVKGQIHSGVIQGSGRGSTGSGLTYDRATRQLLAGSCMDYAMPGADDMLNFDVDSHEVPTAVHAGSQGGRGGRHGGRAARPRECGERRAVAPRRAPP